MSGRKTYLLSGLLLVVTLGLLAAGKLSPATTLALIALGGFPATFRSALARHSEEELRLLAEIAAAGAGLAIHNYPIVREAGGAAVMQALQLGRELQADCSNKANGGQA
jgi:hypothetical protein